MLDEQEQQQLLIQNKLVTESILLSVTYEELVAAGFTLGAAKVVKMLFPGPTEGELVGQSVVANHVASS